MTGSRQPGSVEAGVVARKRTTGPDESVETCLLCCDVHLPAACETLEAGRTERTG